MAEREDSAMVQLKVRMRETLRRKLEEEAQRTGGSINAEVVNRLERSFHNERVLDEALNMAFGSEAAAFMLLVGRAIQGVEGIASFAGRHEVDVIPGWLNSPAEFAEVRDAISRLLTAMAPPGELRPFGRDRWIQSAGEMVASQILKKLTKSDPTAVDAAILEKLGPAKPRILAVAGNRKDAGK